MPRIRPHETEYDALVARVAALESNRELLWSNQNPNSGFNAQTVQLDLSSLERVLIVVKYAATVNNYAMMECLVDGNKYSLLTTNSSFIARRYATVSTTGITFSASEYLNSSGAQSGGATYSVPVKIYAA